MASFHEIKAGPITIGWSVDLSHDEVERIAVGAQIADILGVMPADVAAVVTGMAAALKTTCAAGGHHGVHLHHVANVTIPTPQSAPAPPQPSTGHQSGEQPVGHSGAGQNGPKH